MAKFDRAEAAGGVLRHRGLHKEVCSVARRPAAPATAAVRSEPGRLESPPVIGHLRGTLLKSAPEGVLLDVQGVGYAVNVPLSTFYELEKSGVGSEIGLHIHTHAREDVLALYGFWSEREKQLFEKLIAVNGIGPRLAQVILSGMAPDDLLAALAVGDTARLTTIPGVGKKTAERMVLELQRARAGSRGRSPDAPRTGGRRSGSGVGQSRLQARARRARRRRHPERDARTPRSTSCCAPASSGCRAPEAIESRHVERWVE